MCHVQQWKSCMTNYVHIAAVINIFGSGTRMNEVISSDNPTPWSSQKDLNFQIIGQQIPFAQQVFRLTVISVGLFMNSFVFLVVAGSKQLHYPRHIFWAVVSMVDCLFLVESILEIRVIVKHDLMACRAFVLLAGVDYTMLLVCLSLAALDRYLAIARYEWYKRQVTVRGVILVLTIACAGTFLIITFPFWMGHESIYNCTVNMTRVHYVFACDLLLGILCVIVHIKIFVKSKRVIGQYTLRARKSSMIVRFVNHPTSRSSYVICERDVQSQNDRPSCDDRLGNECFSWIPTRSKVNRLEVRAALTMSANIVPFWLCTFPVSIHALALYWCILLQADCYAVFHMTSYLRDFFMFHSIYNPVMFMVTNSEFQRALLHVAWKLKRGFN